MLATVNSNDFIYTCDGHLTDRGFATLIEPPQDDPASDEKKKVSDEEIRRIKAEWEERQRQKQQKAKVNDKDKDKDKDNEKVKSVPPPKPPPPKPSPIPVPGATTAVKPAHQRYTLHRDVWAMRLTEHRKRRQRSAVKEVAPRLPITPRGGIA